MAPRPVGEGTPARVSMVEPMGADTLVCCRSGGETVGMRAPATGAPRVGGALGLARDPRRARFFGGETGRRIEGVPA